MKIIILSLLSLSFVACSGMRQKNSKLGLKRNIASYEPTTSAFKNSYVCVLSGLITPMLAIIESIPIISFIPSLVSAGEIYDELGFKDADTLHGVGAIGGGLLALPFVPLSEAPSGVAIKKIYSASYLVGKKTVGSCSAVIEAIRTSRANAAANELKK